MFNESMFDNYLFAAADESYKARYLDDYEEEVEEDEDEYEESEDEDMG